MEQISFSSNIETPISQLMTSSVVNIYNVKNELILGRALLDTCSSANFVTEKFVNKLRIKKEKCSIPVGTLDKLSTVTKYVVQLTFESIHNAFEKTITCLTVPEISKFVPNVLLTAITILNKIHKKVKTITLNIFYLLVK